MADAPVPLTRHVHFSFGFFDSTMPPKVAKHIETLKTVNPSFQFTVWGPKESREAVQQVVPHRLHVYDTFPWPIQRSDMSRYAILYLHGGMYADIDYMFKAPLEVVLAAALPSGKSAFVNETPNATKLRRRMSNSFMGARAPHHPFWLTVLNAIHSGKGLSRHAKVLSSAGPQAVDRALTQWRKTHHGAADTVHVLPKQQFNPCSICDRNALTTADKSSVLAVHANGGTWNSGWSRMCNTLACDWPWAAAVCLLAAGFIVALVFAVKRQRTPAAPAVKSVAGS